MQMTVDNETGRVILGINTFIVINDHVSSRGT